MNKCTCGAKEIPGELFTFHHIDCKYGELKTKRTDKDNYQNKNEGVNK